MSSSGAQGGRPLKRQPTEVPIPAGQTGSRPKKTTARRKPHKERSMRIPAIENDLMNRIGVSKKKRKAVARAASTKSTKSSSPYKNLLVGIARTEDPTSEAEDSTHLVRCESPSPSPKSSPSRPASPQPPELPATATGATEAKGKKQRITGQSSIVLRPLPSRVAASSSHRAGSPTVHPLYRTPHDALTTLEARPTGTASPSSRSRSFLPRKRSPLAVAPPIENFTSVPVPVAVIPDDSAGSPAQSAGVQGEGAGAPHVDSSEESDSQSEDFSISDVTSHESEPVGSSVPDISAANVAQAAAMKRSLLCQIEGRNEGGKWDDLQGFLHSLAPSEICGLLKTATRAGRRALRRLAGKETADSDNRNEEDDSDARILGRAQGESVFPPDDAGSDGEEAVTVPPRRRRFLYKAKGKARARSPSPPPLPSSPSPVFVSQTGAVASSSRASNCLVTRKRSRTPESASGDDDTPEPPTKRQKREPGHEPRPLRREGAFIHYPAPLPAEDTDHRQTAHVNLVQSFLDQVQDLDVSGWLSRGSGITPPNCDPFVAARDDDDDDGWTLGAELRGAARRRHRGARVDDDDATQRPSLYAVSRT
ncbi:hypothetical protein EDB86DRAFT_3087253 [Lactarius hatsudake]|nr:hypothetical protein EDB86DRAFT_3087253 [Lactarius hatsudake]